MDAMGEFQIGLFAPIESTEVNEKQDFTPYFFVLP